MSESWEKDECKECHTNNWYCLGDVSDYSVPDIDGTECYKCGHKEIFAEYSEDEEDIDFKIGLKEPKIV